MREQGVPAKALLIGEGPERAAIEREVIRLALRGHVAITGFKADVRPYVGCCDAMVLVSRSEGFSLAALEAMALGKPMVMGEVGGASEQIVHGEHGFLYPVGDTAALARHLAALAEPRLRRKMGDAAAARVRERFTMKAMVAEYERRLLGLYRGSEPRRTRARSRRRMRSTPTQ